MANKRKLTIDFANIIDISYDKIDSGELQEFLEELLNDAKSDPKKCENVEKYIKQLSMIFPGVGSSFEEFEDNVRNGNIVDCVQAAINIFRKGLTSGDFETQISKVLSETSSQIKETIVPKKRKLK